MRPALFIFIICLSACSAADYETIVIRGSDTEVNLVLTLAETYMNVHDRVSIAVTGGGSGTGIAALLNKKTDIANSSRDLRKEERAMALERGVDVIPVYFAMDALCFIVHPDNPVDSLTLDALGMIYRGEIVDWSEVDTTAPELDISLYGRQGNSGTFLYIQQELLKGDYSPSMKQMNGTSQIIESIKHDEAGIGYVGVGYVIDHQELCVEGVKVLAVKETDSTRASSPRNRREILDGTYPITRPLYQFLDGSPDSTLLAFLRYELSAEGQKLVAENGYFPLIEKYRQQNPDFLQHE